MIEAIYNDPSIPVPHDQIQPGERRRGNQPRKVQTLLGEVTLSRNTYHSSENKRSRIPLDESLEIMEGCTPAAAKLICRSACREPFKVAAEDLDVYAGLQINARRIQRIVQRIGPSFTSALHSSPPEMVEKDPIPRMYISADGTGVPLRAEALKGRRGRQADGSAKTHEVKIGCVFTQQPREGQDPFRDLDSTSYIATPERAGPFAQKLLTEARRRNLGGAKEVIFISDGAKWLREIARTHFPQATRILDFYHAMEHLHDLVHSLYKKESEGANKLIKKWTRWLLNDRVGDVITHARKQAASNQQESVDKQLGYFEANQDAMQYGSFQKRGLFVGSGVVEAGCKTIVGKRLKQSGMFWSESGAGHILSFRSMLYSRRFDEIWENNLAEDMRDAA